MSNKNSRYDLRGVSASKDEVHAAIKDLDKGLYPYAFCKVLPDFVAHDASFCNIMHADTAGTKTSLAYLYWKETGDVSIWKGIAQDSIVMNVDDMACAGCIDDIILSSTIGRNKSIITGEVIKVLIDACVSFIKTMKSYGVDMHLSGGETADVGDIVRTIDVGYTAFGRLKREDVITNDIKAGQVIVGLASYGQATYEEEYNAGTGSNGLTSARHDILHHMYADMYPETYNPHIPEDLVYSGSKKLTDTLMIDGVEHSIGKLILSPTRTFLPVIKSVFDQVGRNNIKGMIHCTGGAQSKVKKFIKNKRIIKDNLLPIPPLFAMIKEESQTTWQEMYEVFNMGHRLEFYVDTEFADQIVDISKSFNIDAKIIGRVEDCQGEEVIVQTEEGRFVY